MLWVDVLNRALEWHDAASLATKPHTARAATVLRPDMAPAVRRDVDLLRRVFASMYLDIALPDAQRRDVRQWLAAVTLEHVAARDSRLGGVLRARRSGTNHPEPYESLLSSALVQLLGSADAPGALTAVHRCHGIQRPAPGTDDSPWPQDLEAAFAHRARLDALLPDASLRQCACLVFSERGSRYCSKACSNANFAVRKSRRDPRYFAEKQERYRRRKEQRPEPQAARVDRGAFVYMD